MEKNISQRLGWHARPQRGFYPSGLPTLSSDEEELLSLLSERFADWAKTHDASSPEAAKAAVEQLLPRLLVSQGLEADDDQLQYLTAATTAHLAGFVPLDQMLSDESIEEVAVIGLPSLVWLEQVHFASRLAGH